MQKLLRSSKEYRDYADKCINQASRPGINPEQAKYLRMLAQCLIKVSVEVRKFDDFTIKK